MPDKKYIKHSVTLKYWDMIAREAEKKYSDTFKKYISLYKPYREAIEKTSDYIAENQLDKYVADYHLAVSEMERYLKEMESDKANNNPDYYNECKLEADSCRETANACLQYKEKYDRCMSKLEAISTDFYDNIDGYKFEVDKNGNIIPVSSEYNMMLYEVCCYKQYVKKYSNKETSKDEFGKLRAILKFVSEEMFAGENAIAVNGSEKTGAAAAKLFANMAKRDLPKFKVAKPDTVENAMEYEKIEGIPQAKDCGALAAKIYLFSENMKELDNNFHVNSREFKAMKKALKDISDIFSKKEVSAVEIGNALENLQVAAVNYVSEKGFDGQYTDLGKQRLDFALNLANCAYEYGEKFPSLAVHERDFAVKNSFGYTTNVKNKYMENIGKLKFEMGENFEATLVDNGAENLEVKDDFNIINQMKNKNDELMRSQVIDIKLYSKTQITLPEKKNEDELVKE